MPIKTEYVQDPSGVTLKIEDQPSGPLVTIEQNGIVTVHRGTTDEAAKLFWDAVNQHGVTYRDRILQLERMVMALSTDPFKSIVHGGAYEVRANMVKKIPLVDVNAVLDTINAMAQRAIQ